MTIGIPKEIKPQEQRVGLTPAAVQQLISKGHYLLVESGAGLGSGFPDSAYERAGAIIVTDHAEVFEKAEFIIKVKEPLREEYGLLRAHHLLFTYLHLAASWELTEGLMRSGATCVAYETVESNGRLPLLEPMSEIAGRMSALVGAYHLSGPNGGGGVLLSGVPGVLPGKVLVLGGGTAGINAARMAVGLGADVSILELDHERIRFLDTVLPGVSTLYSTEAGLRQMLPEVDLLIGAVLVPGARAPRLVTRDMLRSMKPGSVLVDIAVDQGGCVETTRATTHSSPTYVEEGVVHYCVANMPGAYARTATEALTNVTYKYAEAIADLGFDKACEKLPSLVSGLNVANGQIVSPVVAAAFSKSAASI